MGNFVVSARKYRPDTFKSVVGQLSITSTLKNALATSKLGHAYLFTGPRGVGKTTCARIFAKTINCYELTVDHEPCNVCESCTSFNDNRSYNIHELDAASNNSVEDIRLLAEKVRIKPQLGKYSVYIIDEVHMLSTSAFNAFLKTLEEPPAHAVFILATTEKHKILPTILSRCQIFDFNRITVEDAANHLAYVAKSEGIEADMDALNVIAQKADGGMRDALSMFDQIVSFSSGSKVDYASVIENLNVLDYEFYFRLVDALLASNVSEALLIFDEILNKGFDGHHFSTGLASHLRDLLICKDEVTLKLLQVGASIRERYLQQAKACQVVWLYKAIDITNGVDQQYKASQNKRLLVELSLIKVAQLLQSIQVEATNVVTVTTTAPAANAPVAKSTEQPAQQTPTTAPTPTQQAPAEANPTPETPRTVEARGAGVRPATSVSIQSLMSQEQETSGNATAEAAPIYTTTPTNESEPVTQEAMLQAWDRYAEVQLSSPRLKNFFKSNRPLLLDNTVIQVPVSNSLQADSLREQLEQLQNYLRQQLHNSALSIDFKAEATETQERKIYTTDDKYKYLEGKNPILAKLKVKFGLDF